MRLFIAVRMNAEMRSALQEVQRQMRSRHVQGSYIPPENLHLTLAFIGEYPNPDDIPLPPVRPFPLALEGFGAFGDLWWVGTRPSEALSRCSAGLRRALADAGIPFDRKRFSPHITVLRRGVGQPVVSVPGARMTVDHLSLMRSDRGKGSMIYTEIARSEPWA